MGNRQHEDGIRTALQGQRALAGGHGGRRGLLCRRCGGSLAGCQCLAAGRLDGQNVRRALATSRGIAHEVDVDHVVCGRLGAHGADIARQRSLAHRLGGTLFLDVDVGARMAAGQPDHQLLSGPGRERVLHAVLALDQAFDGCWVVTERQPLRPLLGPGIAADQAGSQAQHWQD
ncbi:hypothetical protein D3C80_1334930 [compost metagenome]